MYSTNTGSVQLYVHRKVKKLQIKKLSIASVSSYVNFFLYAFYSKVLFLPKEHSLFKKIWKRKPSQDTLDSSSASTGLCLQLSLSCVHQCSPNSRAEWNSISVKLSIIYLSISLSICASILHLPPLSYHYLFSIICLPFTFLSCLSICLPISLATYHSPTQFWFKCTWSTQAYVLDTWYPPGGNIF